MNPKLLRLFLSLQKKDDKDGCDCQPTWLSLALVILPAILPTLIEKLGDILMRYLFGDDDEEVQEETQSEKKSKKTKNSKKPRNQRTMSNDYNDPARKGGSIQTYSGLIFYPLDPRIEEIEVEDVAHALSHKARFTGHTRKFYSTAEHSVRVSLHLATTGASLMEQYVGLHHDDTDAYLPDVPTPLKVLPEFRWFKELEHHMQELCFEKFGCVVEDYSVIKNSDIVLLLTEKRDLMPKKNSNWNHRYTQQPIPEPYRIEPWEPAYAKQMYLHMHHIFSNAIQNGMVDVYKKNIVTL